MARPLLPTFVVLLAVGLCWSQHESWALSVQVPEFSPESHSLQSLSLGTLQPIIESRTLGKGFEKFLILTTTTIGRANYAVNWARMHQRLGLKNFLIIAEDRESFEFLYPLFHNRVVCSFEYSSPVPLDSYYGSKAFGSVVSLRPRYIGMILKMGIDVLYSDTDTILMRDPLRDIVETINAKSLDVVGQQDQLRRRKDYVCTGFMYLRSNARTIHVVDEWQKKMEKRPGSNQRVFYLRMWQYRKVSKGSFQFDTLPPMKFSSGNIAFREYKGNLDKQLKSRRFPNSLPVMVHLNYANSAKMKSDWATEYNFMYTHSENMMYRYNSPGWHCARRGFISATPKVLLEYTVGNLSMSFTHQDIPATEFLQEHRGGRTISVEAGGNSSATSADEFKLTLTGLLTFELHHAFISASGDVADPCHGLFSHTVSAPGTSRATDFSKELQPLGSAVFLNSKPLKIDNMKDAFVMLAPLASQGCRIATLFPWINLVVQDNMMLDVVRSICSAQHTVHVLNDHVDSVLYTPHLQIVMYPNHPKYPVLPLSLGRMGDTSKMNSLSKSTTVAFVGGDSLWSKLQVLSEGRELLRVTFENYAALSRVRTVVCSSKEDLGWVTSSGAPYMKMILLDLSIEDLKGNGYIFNSVASVEIVSTRGGGTDGEDWVRTLSSLL